MIQILVLNTSNASTGVNQNARRLRGRTEDCYAFKNNTLGAYGVQLTSSRAVVTLISIFADEIVALGLRGGERKIVVVLVITHDVSPPARQRVQSMQLALAEPSGRARNLFTAIGCNWSQIWRVLQTPSRAARFFKSDRDNV